MLQGIERAVIIYNPLSGANRLRRAALLEQAQRVLARRGVVAELAPTSAPGEAGRLAAEAVRSGTQLIIVCGGDGTLNETVNGLMRQQARAVPLAMLPAGTANVLAKELRIPWNIPRAASLIASGTAVRIALGRLVALAGQSPDRYFVSVAGAGADAALVRVVNLDLKSRAGKVAYWVAGFRQLVRYRFPYFRATASDGSSYEAALAVVGRTKSYGGPFRITTGADLFGDKFEVALFRSRRPLSYLGYMPATWTGRLSRAPDVTFLKTDWLVCEPLDDSEMYAQVDGEPEARLPVRFEVVPDALTLVVPEAIATERSAATANGKRAADAAWIR
jgi:diacylglycerol kinase (ATP)